MSAYLTEMGIFFFPFVLAVILGFYSLYKDSLGAFGWAMALFVSGFIIS